MGWEHARRGARPVFVTGPGRRRQAHLRHALRAQPGHLPEPAPRRRSRRSASPRSWSRAATSRRSRGLLRESQLDPRGRRAHRRALRRRARGERSCPKPRAAHRRRPSPPRCHGCDVREPGSVDHLVGEPQPEPPAPAMTIDERVAALDALPPRRALGLLDQRAVRQAACSCYACRQACPLCVCDACIVEKTRPAVDRVLAAPARQLRWNITRAIHLAGRCVGLRRVRALLPGRHPAQPHQPQASADRARALRLHRQRRPRGAGAHRRLPPRRHTRSSSSERHETKNERPAPRPPRSPSRAASAATPRAPS